MTRLERVVLARNSPLARKPVPVLLCLMKLYVREELCVGSWRSA